MASPRRVSARQSSSSAASGAKSAPKPSTSIAKGKGKPTTMGTDPALAEPIQADRTLDAEFVLQAASTSSVILDTKKPFNGTSKATVLETITPSVIARSSSEELTDIEELDKALTPVAKKPAPKKRKAKGKAPVVDNDSVDGGKPEHGTDEAKPKAKKKRTKKIQGPYLPVVDYPARDLKCRKFIGAHVSISEGCHYAPHRALMLGARAFGLFVSKPLTEDSMRLFPLRCGGTTQGIPDEEGKTHTIKLGDGLGFDPLRHIVPHGSYLTNLCSNIEEQRKRSYDNFLTELKMAESLGIGLFNFHPGSTLGQPREEAYAYLADCINEAHRETKFITVLLENMASRKNIVGGSFEDLAAVITLVKDKTRIGVCFDTCHGFAAGYDLRSEEAYNETWKQFDDIIGLRYLKAFHVNDSMKGLASGRDLHQNIGAGELGLSAFHLLMRDPRFDGLPFILETPMLSGSLKVEARSTQSNGYSTGNGIHTSLSEVKLEVKAEEDPVNGHGHSHGDDADVEDNGSGQAGLSLGASTWKREIELLQELEKVPFGQSNDTIDKLSSEIQAIASDYQRKVEEQQKAAKEAKDATKEAKKAALLAEKGDSPEKEAQPQTPKGSRKAKVAKVEVKERSPSEEMEIDSSEVDQLASDYEE